MICQKNFSLCLLCLIANLFATAAFAEEPSFTNTEINESIDSITNILKSNYVYPEKAEKLSKYLNKNHRKGKYKGINNEMEFAQQIQQDLLSVINDTHLIFEFNPEHAALLKADNETTNDSNDIKTVSPEMQRFNFGFQSMQIMNGNIGYLKLNGFYDTDHASNTAVAAMNYLSHADAIIFDLRQNSGGSFEMVQLLSSYLFDSKPVHLSGFYWRPDDKHTQNWTLPHVPGKRNPEAEVIILTSAGTHSAAEEFSYNLKHLKRATVIGETTMGGAHPGKFMPVNDRFVLFVPYGRSTNPITNTNWEGVGVIPDIEVNAADALAVAKINALEKLSSKNPDENGDLYRWFLVSENARLNPLKLSNKQLQAYAGTYGPRTLLVEANNIYYQREGGPKLLLNALQEDLFELAVDNSFRMKIIKEDGVVIALQGLFDNGYKDQFAKTNKK